MRQDWVECISSDILDVRDGTHDTPKYINEGFPLVTSKNLKNGEINFDNVKFISEEEMLNINQRSKVDVGDVLFAMIGTIGNPVVVKQDPKYSIKNIGLFKNNKGAINSYFLKYYLESSIFEKQIIDRELLKGTTQKFIPLGNLRNIILPFPPLPEQRAIVKKIEALFSSLDAGIADLKKAQDQLKIYRQAVLKKAFEGELTKEWREKQTDLPTAEELKQALKLIIDEALKNKNITKGNYFPDYANGSSGFNIPNKWNFFALKAIVQPNKTSLKRGPFGSALKKEFFIEKGVPVYEQGHAINDEPFRHRYFISDEKYEELKGFTAGPNDLIISCSGATLGRICHLPQNADIGIINQALLKISLNERIILHKYFIIMFRSEIFQRLIFEKSLGTAMPNMVGMNELKDIAIPIPSIQEQAQIVKEIEARLSVCDAVEQQIKDSLSQAEALRQSILKKAFEGRLLSDEEIKACQQEPDYEPASVLLKKIKAEKEANKPQKKTKKK